MHCLLCHKKEGALFYKSNRQFFRCRNCGLVFVPEAEHVSSQAEKDRYDHHQNSLSDENYLNYLRACLGVFAPHFKAGDSLLDFGSGRENPLAVLAAEQGFDCKSYDLFYHPESAPLESTYEGILCFETCEHFRNPAYEFSRLFSLLKKNGLLALRTEFLPVEFSSWFYHRDPTHLCFFSEECFRWIAKCFGVELVFCAAPFVLLKKI